ncbi:MAG: Gx transporter family protein [Spirochaetota bacterium]
MQAHSEESSRKNLNLVALFAAFSIFLSTIEYLIPRPLPFFRLGLANLPILIALDIMEPQFVILLIALKALTSGLINGTLFSYIFLFSFTGSFGSGIVMLALWKIGKNRISLIGVSMLGALSSNLVQLLLAGRLVVGEGIWLIGPPFLIAGFITSILLGFFAIRFSNTSDWFKALKGNIR